MRSCLTAALLSLALTPSGALAADHRLPARATVNESKGLEGNSGQAAATVTITQPAGNLPQSYPYRTIDGTATAADTDYLPLNGVLTIRPGKTTGTIDVTIIGDTQADA